MKIFYHRKLVCLAYFSLLLAACSCVNLQAVTEYSATSMAGIQNFEEIDYSFLQHCLDRCTDEAIATYAIKPAQECSCSLYQQADSVTQVIYNTLAGYFEGLNNLSNNQLTNYSSDALVSALSADALGPVKVDAASVTAFSSLSNTLLRASTDLYRKKKLGFYIEQANEPIQVLLKNFTTIINTNLRGELKFKRARLYKYYMDMKMNRTLVSEYEKGQATSDYYQELEEINRKEKALAVFAESVVEIAEGHQVLYDNRNKLSVKELSGLLFSYSSNVKDLISEFNKLKD